MKQVIVYLCVVGFFMFIFAQVVQADEISELKVKMKEMEARYRKEMAELQARIEGLEAKERMPTEVPEPQSEIQEVFGEVRKRVRFHGALDLRFDDWGSAGYKNGESTFDVYEVYLATSARVSDDVSLYFEPRYEHAGESIELRQGYIDWQIAEPVSLRMGKFYMPIGIYRNMYYAPLRKFVTYSYPARLITVAPWEDVGLELHGEVPIANTEMKLKYELAVLNGLNEDYTQHPDNKVRNARQNRDNNSNKIIGGRVGLSPVEELEVGFSYNTGKYDDAANYRLDFFGADIAYTISDLELKAEYMRSEAESRSGDIKTDGFYVQGAYKVLKDYLGMEYLELVGGVEGVNPGQALRDRFSIASGQQLRKFASGINLSPRDHFLIKTEYQITEEDDPEIHNNAFLFQAVADF